MRKWKKNKKPKGKIAGIPNNHRKLPVGTVVNPTTDKPIRGEHLAMPLFGWVAVREQTETPLVMVTTLLLESAETPLPVASFTIELPVFEELIHPTLAALDRFGWDGRVWPIDDGWPQVEGAESDLEQLQMLMETAGLRASMTFPPGEQGVPCQTVKVERHQGPFLMPPLPTVEEGWEPDPNKHDRFLNMCENPRQFYNPMQAATTLPTEPRDVRVGEDEDSEDDSTEDDAT